MLGTRPPETARSFAIDEDPVRRKDGSLDLSVHELFPASDLVVDLAVEGHVELGVVEFFSI